MRNEIYEVQTPEGTINVEARSWFVDESGCLFFRDQSNVTFKAFAKGYWWVVE